MPFSRPSVLRGLAIVVGAFVLLTAASFPILARGRDNARRSSCQSNMKQIMLGMIQYAQDYGDKFPPVAFNPPPKNGRKDCMSGPAYGWADGLQPYLKSTCIFQCPANAESPSSNMWPEHPGYTDYWFNARLASTKSALAKTNTIALGDGDGKGNSRASRRDLPTNWSNGPDNAWYWNHLGGANYAFADGHVKWLKPEDVKAPQADFAP